MQSVLLGFVGVEITTCEILYCYPVGLLELLKLGKVSTFEHLLSQHLLLLCHDLLTCWVATTYLLCVSRLMWLTLPRLLRLLQELGSRFAGRIIDCVTVVCRCTCCCAVNCASCPWLEAACRFLSANSLWSCFLWVWIYINAVLRS